MKSLLIELARHVPIGEFCQIMKDFEIKLKYDGVDEFVTNTDQFAEWHGLQNYNSQGEAK